MVTVALIRLVQAVCLLMPRPLARACGVGLGLAWYHVLRLRRRLVEENLARAFGSSPSDPEVRRLARANFVHYGLLIIELLRLRKVIRGGIEHEVQFDGIEHLEEARKHGKGVLVLTAHLGNYDLLAVAFACAGYPVSFVSKHLKNRAVEKLWMSERSAAGLKIFTREDPLRDLFRALQRNELLGIILDQHARSYGVWVDFFGRSASTLRTLAVLAERTGAPVLPIFTRRLDDGTHLIEIQPPIPFEPRENREASARHNTQRYTHVIEEAIRRTPEQWTWIHRRWKEPRPA